MKRRSLFLQLFPSYLIITVSAIFLLSWYITRTFERFYIDEAAHDLQARTALAKHHIETSALFEQAELNHYCIDAGSNADIRLTVIEPDGSVIADSREKPSLMDNHADRPEIIEVSDTGYGFSIRHSRTLNEDMMYVALPLDNGEEPGLTVRASLSLASLHNAMDRMRIRIAMAAVLAGFFAAFTVLIVSRRLTGPLVEMTREASLFSKGRLDSRLRLPGTKEMAILAETLNRMAEQLEERIDTVTAQRDEREAVLSSMAEGVIAVDSEERIMRMNSAAVDLLGLAGVEYRNRPVQEMARYPGFLELLTEVLETGKHLETEIVIPGARERFILLSGTPLAAGGRTIGALLVLNDITRLIKLERMRRDFVANLSHELKTPITSIKGSVETLRDGALDHPADAAKFLDIIARQSERLNALFDDLLKLSKIETEHERREIAPARQRISPVLERAAENHALAADRRNIVIDVNCPPGLEAAIDPPLFEEAVSNLIDNAVKYNRQGGHVSVSAVRKEGGGLTVEVADDGLGIERTHLPRLFERFYRTETARARERGGTGLGLAIVKHIAIAHGGSVSVDSTPESGSTFRIELP